MKSNKPTEKKDEKLVSVKEWYRQMKLEQAQADPATKYGLDIFMFPIAIGITILANKAKGLTPTNALTKKQSEIIWRLTQNTIKKPEQKDKFKAYINRPKIKEKIKQLGMSTDIFYQLTIIRSLPEEDRQRLFKNPYENVKGVIAQMKEMRNENQSSTTNL